MFCRTCGKEIPDYSKVCMYCGTTMEEAPAPVQNNDQIQNEDFMARVPNNGVVGVKQRESVNNVIAGLTKTLKSNPKYLAIAAGALIVLIILIIIIASAAGSSNGSFTVREKNFYIVSTSSSDYLFCNGNEIFECDGGYDSFTVSSNGSACALIDGGELYYSKGEAIKKSIAEDISNVTIAENGNGLIYMSGNEIGYYDGGKAKTIYDDDAQVASIAISPDGQTVGYSTYEYVDGDYEWEAYIYRNGKSEELGKYSVLSVSNNAEVVYLVKTSTQKLYRSMNMGEPESISSIVNFNTETSDFRTILFSTDSNPYDTYYFSPSSKDKIKVSGDSVYVLVPEYATAAGSFDNFIGYSDSEVRRYYRKGDEFENYKIANVYSSYDCRLSADAQSLIWLNGNKLYKIATSNENAEKVTLIENVSSFYAGNDVSTIYCVNYDDELVYCDGSESGRRIADDPRDVCITKDGTCLFTIDDILYYSIRGGEKQKVKDCGEVESISVHGNYVVVRNDEDEIFFSSDGRGYSKSKIEY